MFCYQICFSDPSASEKFNSVYFKSVSAAHNALELRGYLLDGSAQDPYLYHLGSVSAWIKKVDFSLPSVDKKVLFHNAKITCDRLIKSLALELSRNGISCSEFARIACIDKGNLSKILSGVIYPNFKTWCRLTSAMSAIDVLVVEHFQGLKYGLE